MKLTAKEIQFILSMKVINQLKDTGLLLPAEYAQIKDQMVQKYVPGNKAKHVVSLLDYVGHQSDL